MQTYRRIDSVDLVISSNRVPSGNHWLRNLKNIKLQVSKEHCIAMVQCKVLKQLSILEQKRSDDEDIMNDVEFLNERLQASVQDLSSFDQYATEVKSGRWVFASLFTTCLALVIAISWQTSATGRNLPHRMLYCHNHHDWPVQFFFVFSNVIVPFVIDTKGLLSCTACDVSIEHCLRYLFKINLFMFELRGITSTNK